MGDMVFRRQGAPTPTKKVEEKSKSRIRKDLLYKSQAHHLVEIRKWAVLRQSMISYHNNPESRKYDELVVTIDSVLDKIFFMEDPNGD